MTQMWKKTLSFLGLVEEYDDEYADLPEEPPIARHEAPPARSEPSNVRRIAPAPARGHDRHERHDRAERPDRPSASSVPQAPQPSNVRPVTSHKVHVTNPSTFNDVEEVGERFRNGIPVIMNLDGSSEAVAKRLLDFASGLIYGLDGRIERVGDRVFLLTPVGTDVSTEERRRLSERGFFNQA
jgi:cell division inhibitor SepF